MINPDNRLFCRLDGATVSSREQQRLAAIAALGLLESDHVPVFDEATQAAAHFINIPVCILGLLSQSDQRFKASVGLSRLGLKNELATSSRLPRSESFCTHVVDSHQVLAIEDTFAHPAFANGLLAQQYGVRAYLGVPLITSNGVCIGTLAVMDLRPHCFNAYEIEFLELTARWSMSEFERQQAVKNQTINNQAINNQAIIASSPAKTNVSKSAAKATNTTAYDYVDTASIAGQLKIELLSQLTQELRTPLTSVMGMTSVLLHEIYGPLTHKQKEYLDIIRHSGQYLLSLVNEILELSILRDSGQELNLTPVDIEMLCQQAINTLEQAAHRREQQIRLSVEPGQRIWRLDKDKMRQMLYHLMFNVIQASNAGSIIRLHVSHRDGNLIISIWMSHPWLGEGFPYAEANSQSLLMPIATSSTEEGLPSPYVLPQEAKGAATKALSVGALTTAAEPVEPLTKTASKEELAKSFSKNLGLLLSRQLAEMHGGQLTIQGASESGYRYIVNLPPMSEAEASSDSA